MTTRPRPEDLGTDPAPPGRTPLRGRETERAYIEDRLDRLALGTGAIVRIEGPPGSGRTRLLAEAAASARRRGMRVFQGSADAGAYAGGGGCVGEGAYADGGGRVGEGGQPLGSLGRPGLSGLPGPLGPAVAPGLGPLLEGLLCGEDPLPGAARLRDLAQEPGSRFWLLHELADRLREVARGGPLVVVLDDLQWCDDLTLLTFHTVAARLVSHPVLWLVAVRGGSVPPRVRTTLERIRESGAHALSLEPLDDRAVARIAADLLGAVPGPGDLRLARRAEGVPALLVELLGAFTDGGRTVVDEAPRSLAFVERRLALLSGAARALVETVAVAEPPVTVESLGELLGRPAVALLGAVREALDADLLTEDGEVLAFRHALVREAVAAGLPPSRRTSGHPEERAAIRHRPTLPSPATGADAAETEARTHLELARQALPSDFAEAARQAGAGAALPGVPPHLRARLLALRCLALALSGKYAAAESTPAPAREWAAADPAAEVTLAVAESVMCLYRMDWNSAFRHAERAAALGSGQAADTPEALWQGLLLNATGRSREALAMATAASTGSGAGGWASVRARALLDLGRPAEARAETEAVYRAGGGWGGGDPAAMGDPAAVGDLAAVTLVPTRLHIALHTGDRDELARAGEAARRLLRRDTAPAAVRATAAWMLALLADAEGRPTRVRAALDEGATLSDPTAPKTQATMNDPPIAHDPAAANTPAALSNPAGLSALAGLDAPAARNEQPASLPEERLLLPGLLDPGEAQALVRVALRAGAHEWAAAAVDAAERRAALNPGHPILAATAAHARALLGNDLGLLLRAARLYEDGDRPLARASALEDAGRKLAATRTPEAVPHLSTALALYTRAGATRDVERVRRRLRAAGVRREPSSAGYAQDWPELTGAELRVVRLVARGLTNRQVATELALSPHTVGTHVRRVYTKLGIASRQDLTRLVRSRDSGE
ncbi:AAA family ATPase [Streptomyces sp. NPDC015131]|uniref:ATP-binding protein n=1 Tax=Streptomyces sp. NPDC015131 TaxID=3364941 RepID=UPI0037018C67